MGTSEVNRNSLLGRGNVTKKKVIQFILYRGFIFQLVSTDLKKIGWSVKDGADASFSFPSSLPDVEKPLWLKRL